MNETASTRPVLVIGGTGVFGSRLAEGLCRDGVADVIVAGRSEAKLRAVSDRLGCAWRVLDTGSSDLGAEIAAIGPAIVIDAAGPFQAYDVAARYRLARAALAADADYFDLSDDAAFTAGIRELDAEARSAGRAVLSGVSSVPALSAAAVRALSDDMGRIDLIESMILPGNRAPRGRSVMAAILAQAGKPLPGTDEYGWIGLQRVRIEPDDGPGFSRLASPIGAPDQVLMPERFRAGDVRFRAGLELSIMHRGLGFMAWAVRRGLLRSALPLLPLVHPAARLLEPFGSDLGAMRVLVRGETETGPVERLWWVVARKGDGPHIPAIPGRVLVRKLLAGEVAPGARACLDDLGLEALQAGAPERAVSFGRAEHAFRPVFAECLGAAFDALPEELQALHRVAGRRDWHGTADVTRSRSLAARVIAWAFGFPPARKDTPVTVKMVNAGGREIWTRDFGGHQFLSNLTPDPERPGRMWERFGPFSFAIDFEVGNGRLAYPVSAGRLWGIPIPGWLLPKSDTSEAVDEAGRATFDVALSMPLVGPIVRYRGWLEPDQPIMGDQEVSVS